VLKAQTVLRALPALAVAASLSLAHAVPAGAGGPGAATTPGEVIALQGTDHLWVADDQGVVHLAGDAAALAGKPVAWDTARQATLADLRALPRGEPWLSADLVQVGDALYLPQFAAPGRAPTLLHVQSPQDLALLGVDGDDYARLVLDPATWQQRYGFDPARLAQDELRLYPAPAFDDDSGSSGLSEAPLPAEASPSAPSE
jgi:hypothetical protein